MVLRSGLGGDTRGRTRAPAASEAYYPSAARRETRSSQGRKKREERLQKTHVVVAALVRLVAEEVNLLEVFSLDKLQSVRLIPAVRAF